MSRRYTVFKKKKIGKVLKTTVKTETVILNTGKWARYKLLMLLQHCLTLYQMVCLCHILESVCFLYLLLVNFNNVCKEAKSSIQPFKVSGCWVWLAGYGVLTLTRIIFKSTIEASRNGDLGETSLEMHSDSSNLNQDPVGEITTENLW